MTEFNYQDILSELYAIDPTLKEHEAELIQLIARMQQARPGVKIDKAFADNLRRTLLEKNISIQPNFISFFMSQLKRPLLVGSVLALGAVALAFTYMSPLHNTSRYAALPGHAFGDLLAVSSAAPVDMNASASNAFAVRDSAGGEVAPSLAPTVLTKGMGVSSVANKMIAPFYNYTYKYVGEPLNLADTELAVFRRIKNMGIGKNFADLLSSKNNGMIDLSRFSGTELQTFQLVQNTKEGYTINVDVQNGTVNINPVYEKWYTPCMSDNCPTQVPLTQSDLPENQKIIEIANAFLSQFGIAKEIYAEPIVDRTWENTVPMPMLRATDTGDKSVTQSEPAYIPDVITVIYPIRVGGKEITESNGQEFGLRVSVDIRKMKVQSVWNLTNEQYEQSNYAAETDANRIIKIAENGALGWYQEKTENTRELHLGTPEKVSLQYYQYIPETGTNNELYVPALRFPVINPPTDQPYFYQRSIVVPLVKEILPQFEPQKNPQPPIHILKDDVVNMVVPASNIAPAVQGIRAPDAGEVVDPKRRY